MENLAWKIRIAVLWVYKAVATSTIAIMMLFDPFNIEQIMSGVAMTDSGLVLFIWIIVPLSMAFLSMTLEDSANRWGNIILGIVFTGLNILGLSSTIFIEQRSVHEILTEASKVAVAALIARYAWKWTRKEA